MEQDYRDNWYALIVFIFRLLPVEQAIRKYDRPEVKYLSVDGEWISMLKEEGFLQKEIAYAYGITESRVSHILRDWKKEQRG